LTDEAKSAESKKTSSFRLNLTPYVLVIGLGIHSMFEGIAVGMGTTMSKVSMMALAIVMHKGAAGMTLGTAMVRAFPDQEKHIIFLIFMFAIFTPLGVMIGWALNQSSPMAELVFNCLAAGTFVYISCSEVIVEEFGNPQNKMIKFLFFLIGICFISCLGLVESAAE